jgi:hypothetical protein
MSKGLGKHTKIVMKEMCKRVNANFNKINFLEPLWFHKYTWNDKQEEDFRIWFEKYLWKNRSAREEICRYSIRDKKMISAAVRWFIFDYGWKNGN